MPNAATINLQHTPWSIHCLGIFMSRTVDVCLLKLQFSSFISRSLQLSLPAFHCFSEQLGTFGSSCAIARPSSPFNLPSCPLFLFNTCEHLAWQKAVVFW